MKLKPSNVYTELLIEDLIDIKNIENSRFDECVFARCVFANSLIQCAEFKDCAFIDCSFRESNLQSAKFTECVFGSTCDFVLATISYASFKDSDLEGCTMCNMQADNVDFISCNLWDTNLSDSCLHGANFKNSNMRYCDLSFSDCTQCNFTGARIALMDLEDTKLDNIKGAKMLHLKIGDFELYAYSPKHIKVGCQVHSLKHWDEYAYRIAKRNNALEEFTRYYPGAIKKLKEFYKEVQHETKT